MPTQALYERHAYETDLNALRDRSPRLYIRFFLLRESVHENGGWGG